MHSTLYRSTLLPVVLGAVLSVAAVACGDDDRKESPPDRHTGFPASPANQPLTRTAVVPQTERPVIAEPEPARSPEPVVAEPTSFSELMTAGKEELAAGGPRDALLHFQRAAEMQPENASVRIQVARAALVVGDLATARDSVELAVEIDPESSFAWNTMGRLELAEGDHDAAIASFQRATEESEDNSYAWNNLGYAFMEIESYDEAAEALESATSGTSPTDYMWNNLGMAYEHLDRIEDARAAYRQGAEAGSAKAQLNLERLEGVTSLIPAGDGEVDDVRDGGQPLDEGELEIE